VFLGDFTGTGGTSGGGDIFFEGDLRPGNSPAAVTYQNNVYFGGGAQLDVEIGGEAPGTEHDQITVNGALSLDGTLNVALLEGFTPMVGDRFDILNWTSVGGAFDHLVLQPPGVDLAWDTSDLYNTGELSIVEDPGLDGDFNEDGTVDVADFVMWQKNGGPPGDYGLWTTNFGRTETGGGSDSGPASQQPGVPEPCSAMLVILGIFALCYSGHRCAVSRGEYGG
jgi:hypothetical protein